MNLEEVINKIKNEESLSEKELEIIVKNIDLINPKKIDYIVSQMFNINKNLIIGTIGFTNSFIKFLNKYLTAEEITFIISSSNEIELEERLNNKMSLGVVDKIKNEIYDLSPQFNVTPSVCIIRKEVLNILEKYEIKNRKENIDD